MCKIRRWQHYAYWREMLYKRQSTALAIQKVQLVCSPGFD